MNGSKLEFTRLAPEHVERLRPFFRDNRCGICDCTMGGTFIWRDYHKTEFAVADGVLYMKIEHPTAAFSPPRGPLANKRAYERIMEYCEERGRPAVLCSVSESVAHDIAEMFPGSRAWTDRAWSDYLYDSRDMVNLEGRKYSGQRNHINRFLREHPDWSFDAVTGENLEKTRSYIEKFARNFEKDPSVYMEGNRKALETLDNLELYRQFAGALSVSGEIVGVSIGEISGDTLYIHAEKADTSYHGAYPMLMNMFAKRFVTDEIRFVNREEDDGVEGLRTSKLSYHPIRLLEKYMVELKA